MIIDDLKCDHEFVVIDTAILLSVCCWPLVEMDVYFCWLCVTGVEDTRLSAEEMDIQRQENIAYEYLCHLEEAKVYAQFHYGLL